VTRRPRSDRDDEHAATRDRYAAGDTESCVWRHLRFGWFGLLVFLTLGAGLELFHGFKLEFYLNASNEVRRLLWTLAHAHGTLLSLINIGFALTVRTIKDPSPGRITLASRCLIGATVLLPAGFFLGGIFIHAGDPGLPILFVPIGALMLFLSVLVTGLCIPRPQRAQK